MSADQQTNQPTNHQLWFESNYLSVRITIEHDQLDAIKNLFDDYNWCIYSHMHGTANEHFHIGLPGAKSEAIRMRIKRAWSNLGHLGNKFYSIKSYQNGLRGFVFYCHHEGAEPVFKFEEPWEAIVNDVVTNGCYKKHATPEQSGTVKKIRERLSNPQLTMSNVLRQSIKWAREHDTGARDLGSVLKRMVNDGWDPDWGLMSKGCPSEYYDIFAARMQRKPIEEQDWMKPHKRKERLGDVPEIDTDYQFTKRSLLIPRPHE